MRTFLLRGLIFLMLVGGVCGVVAESESSWELAPGLRLELDKVHGTLYRTRVCPLDGSETTSRYEGDLLQIALVGDGDPVELVRMIFWDFSPHVDQLRESRGPSWWYHFIRANSLLQPKILDAAVLDDTVVIAFWNGGGTFLYAYCLKENRSVTEGPQGILFDHHSVSAAMITLDVSLIPNYRDFHLIRVLGYDTKLQRFDPESEYSLDNIYLEYRMLDLFISQDFQSITGDVDLAWRFDLKKDVTRAFPPSSGVPLFVQTLSRSEPFDSREEYYESIEAIRRELEAKE